MVLRDALSMQSVSTIIFLYFANLAPIVAFGGLLGDATDNRMASIEALVGFFLALELINLDAASKEDFRFWPIFENWAKL